MRRSRRNRTCEPSLAARLDKHFAAASALAAAAAIGGMAPSAEAAIVHSGEVNIPIRGTTNGLYINIVNLTINEPGNTGGATVPGHDLNFWGASGTGLWFGPTGNPTDGGGVVNSGAATVLLALTAGTTIDSSTTFSTRTGAAPTTNFSQTEARIVGFRFWNESTSAVHYGWARFIRATSSSVSGTLVEYAYEDQPGVGILAGDTGSGGPPSGACCKPDFTCATSTSAACAAIGGVYQGDASPCGSCPQPGACCLPAGTCSVLLESTCLGQGGTYGGDLSTCGTVACPTRCCMPDGTCSMLTAADCGIAGGISTASASCTGFTCPAPGACCAADGSSCSVIPVAACVVGGGIFHGDNTTCGAVTCGGAFLEAEPNETRPNATPVTFAGSGDYIRGVTTGTVTTAGVLTSLDQFLVKTPAAAPGIFRHRLTLQSFGTAGHIGTIRGFTQAAAAAAPWTGVVGTASTSDSAAQTSNTSTTPARMNQWYGFGKQEQIYYRVTGGTATTADYAAVFSSTAVTPTDLGSFEPGTITMTSYNTPTPADADVWVYDSNFNAIDGFGNDGGSINGGAPSNQSTPFWLRRDYTAGTYYLAVSLFNLANNKGSPSDDNWRTGGMLDFPDAVSSSTTATAGNLSFEVTDAAGTQGFTATHGGPFEVLWYKFTVGTTPPACYANCDESTTAPVLNVGDFTCFLQRFAAGESYANCDQSTTAPVLNVGDFTCFLQQFAAGCP